MNATRYGKGKVSLAVVVVALSAASPRTCVAAGAPQTKPSLGIAVVQGGHRVICRIIQGGQDVAVGTGGSVLLKTAPFEIRFQGDVAGTAVMFTHQQRIVHEVVSEKQPIVSLAGMGAAFDDGTPILDEHAELQPWEEFRKNFGADDIGPMEAELTEKLKFPLKVLDGGLMYVRGEVTAKEWRFSVSAEGLKALRAKEPVYILVFATSAVGKHFVALAGKSLALTFEK